MLKRITRKLAILAVLAGMLSGLAPSMLAVRTAHADEASQSGAFTALDRSSAPAPKRSEAAKPEPLTSADVQVRSAVVPSDALASGTAGTCLFYVTSDMRLTVTPADGTSGTLPTGANASDWPWYRYAAYIRSVSFDPGVKTSSTLSHAFASANTTDPEYSQLESVDLANLDMADLGSMDSAFANDTRLGSVSFKGALNADGITDWTSVFLQSGIESIDLTDVGDAATTVHGLFQGCKSLKTAVIPWAMAHVADASAMFAYDTSLSTLDTTAWRFGAVWNMSDMFNGCKNLAVLDASGWDLSSTTNMGHMFYGCSSLASLDSSGWHVAKAKYVDHMFDGCSSLTAVDVSGWNMSNVSLASYMFYNCAKLATLDTSAWSMPNATDVSHMFCSCRSLATLDVGKLDLGRSVDLRHMFENCISLTTLDVSKWNTGRVQRTKSMFAGCGKLATLDVSHWDTGMVGNMDNMFSGCGSLAALDVAGWNTGGVGDFQSMFSGCGSLVRLDVSKWNTVNARYMNGMFTNCARLAALDVAGWDTSKVTSFDSMFNGCGSLTTLDVSEWDTGRSTRFCHMFDNCVRLARLDVSKWDTGRATILAGMFHKCVRLTTLDVAGWDVSNATDISQMFDTCTNLALLDVSKWNVDKVRRADWLFSGCVNLKTIDVSKWTLHGLGRLYGMFSGCRSVGTLDLSGWDTTGVTSVHDLFHHCVNLTRIYVGDGWDMGRVTEDDSLFDGDVLLVGDDGKGLAYDSAKNGRAYARPNGGYLTLRTDGDATHLVVYRDWMGGTITTARVRDGAKATAPALSATTWLAAPDMTFNADNWWGAFTKDGKRQTGRDDYAANSTTKQVPGGATVRIDVDADYIAAKAGGSIGWNYTESSTGNKNWGGFRCTAGTECSGSSYNTFAATGTIRPYTQINAWSDFGAAVVHHLQLTQVDPVTHNGIARDGYVFTGWDKDVTKPITGDTVYTARYRPAVYRIRFDGNGSTSGAMADQSFTYGTPQALTAATFQRDGYSLTGWNTRPDGTGKSFTDKQTVADLLTHENAVGTLYAQWTPTPPVITVVFHSNDGGTDETVKRVWASNNLDMKAIGLPDGWTKKGFVFHGWNLKRDGSGVEYKAGESLYGRMTTATVDLYADWAGLSSTLPQAGGSTKAPAYGAGLALMVLGAGAWLSAGRRRRMA